MLLLAVAGPTWGQAAPKRRAGSAPTPPVRIISSDPRDPQGPPPPGARNVGQSRIPGASTKPVPRDTMAPAPTDTTLANGVRRAGDSLQLAARRRGQIESTITYTAKDSIQFDVTSKVARLYNGASVMYGDTDLKAALITVNYGTNTMQAEGKRDSVKNRLMGRPVLKDKGGLYTAASIAYNFKSKKAKVTEAVTTQGEGYVSAATIKRMPDGDINGLNGRYTTCNLEHPHFYIQAKKMKMIPGDKVVTGPFNLVIGDVPTPLGFLFGFFPTPNKSRGSGVLIPTFGQAADRGYFLTNGGYYFAPNDYIGVRLTGDIYAGNAQTFGGWGATADISYLKRYTYQGNFNLAFTTRPLAPIIDKRAENSTGQVYVQPPAATSFRLTWNHTPVPKPGGGRFTAGVNASTPGYDRAFALDTRRRFTPQFSSNISYSKVIRNSPVNYSINLRQNQGTDGAMTFTLPDVSVGVTRQYPYQWFGIAPGGKLKAFYEQFTLGYQLTASNEVNNIVAPRSLGSLPLLGGTTTPTTIPLRFGTVGQLLRNGRNGARHQFEIQLGSYAVAQHFRLTPTFSYNEVWFARKLDYTFSPLAQAVRIDTTYGLHRVGSYSTGLSVNTAFYGTVVRRGTHKLQAIRHKVTPSLTYAFTPDYTNRNPRGQDILRGLTDPFNRPITDARVLNQNTFDPYSGSPGSAPGGAQQNVLLFALQNALELKVRNSDDSTGLNPFKKVDIIRNLDFTLSYDFTKPTFKLSTLNVSYSTQLSQKLALNGGAQFDPYQRDSRGQPVDEYLFKSNPRRLVRLLSAGVGTTYSFNPTTGTRKSVVPRPAPLSNDPTLGTVGPPNYYADYIDFDIPWELTVTYAANYSTRPVPLTRTDPRPPLLSLHTANLTGSVNLTPNLKLSSSLNYDIANQSFVYPTVTFTRDLHCWQITGFWIPLGETKGYNFTIAAKSSLLQDLKLSRNRLSQFQ